MDGGSQDNTAQLAASLGCRVLSAPAGLANQCNHAVEHCLTPVILFLSADCRLPDGWVMAVEEALLNPSVLFGAFRIKIGSSSRVLDMVAWGGNIRSRMHQIALPDQGLFVRKQAFDGVGAMRSTSLIPFADLCLRMGKVGEFTLLPLVMQTSSREWTEKGTLTTLKRHLQVYLRFIIKERLPFKREPAR